MLPLSLLLVLLPAADDALTPGRHEISLKIDGWERHAVVQVPKNYDPKKPVPLVLILHGAGGRGDLYLDRNGWAAKADKETFVAVAPDGLPAMPRLKPDFRTNPPVWNSGRLNESSVRGKIDDVAFIKALLDHLDKRLNVDAKRVYVTGHSNGASMTFKLGADMPERFAALAPVAGAMLLKDPKPSQPLPTLYIIGVKDPLVPLAGGEVKLPWGTHKNAPVSEYLEGWARALGCATEAETLKDKDGVKTTRYAPGKSGAALTVYYIEGQGHGWPGGKEGGLAESLMGPSSDKLNATDAVWEFLRDHVRK
jgi:polyhydroxybutyrate depolymerase